MIGDDRYAIIRVVGDSEYFTAYQAHDTLLEQPVFLKVSKPLADGGDANIHEAVIQAHLNLWRQMMRLDAPGLPRLYDVRVDEGGQIMLATQWIGGRTLAEQFKVQPPGGGKWLIELLIGVLGPLRELHERGFVHGDISPPNILVEDGFPIRCWLIDPAPRLDLPDPADLNRRLQLGTEAFQAPEIQAGYRPTPASDIYALGRVVDQAARWMGYRPPWIVKMMTEDSPNARPSAQQALAQFEDRGPAPGSSGGGGGSVGSRAPAPPPVQQAERAPEPGSRGGGFNLLGALANAAGGVAGALGALGRKSVRSSNSQPAAQPSTRPEPPPSAWTDKTVVASTPDIATARTVLASQPVTDQQPNWDTRSALSSVPLPAGEGREKLKADFSVMAPNRVASGSHFFLEVWVAPSDQREAMLEEATRNIRMVERGRRSFINLERDSLITVLLKLPDFEVEEPIETLGFDGDIRNVAFMVKTPSGLVSGAYPGMVKLMIGQAPFASITFELDVVSSAATPDATAAARPMTVRMITRAFASYASPDRGEVLRRIQGIKAAGTDVFLDVIHLRTGEAWEPALYREIDRSDGFFLFWSRNAAASQWVDREWRYALEHHGLDFISPLALEDPRTIAPPVELQSKHFNDMLLAFIKAEDGPKV